MRKIINKLLIFFGIRKEKKEVETFVYFTAPEKEDFIGVVDSYSEVPSDYSYPPWDGKPIVAIDFDGVIHNYTSGWTGADNIVDAPVSKTLQRTDKIYTSIDWLTELIRSEQMHICIFSSRNHQEGGIKAMKTFLMDYGMEHDVLLKISFPEHKPSSHILIDDRCMVFTGNFFSVDQILKFKPWKP